MNRARAGSAVALAGFRHPVATSATMARPAIQPAAVVTSVMLTQSDSVKEPPAGVRAPRKVHRAWAIPLAVVGVAVIVTPMVLAFVPARFVIDKSRCVEFDDAGVCTVAEDEEVEFAMV